jgi:hypothetical protein
VPRRQSSLGRLTLHRSLHRQEQIPGVCWPGHYLALRGCRHPCRIFSTRLRSQHPACDANAQVIFDRAELCRDNPQYPAYCHMFRRELDWSEVGRKALFSWVFQELATFANGLFPSWMSRVRAPSPALSKPFRLKELRQRPETALSWAGQNPGQNSNAKDPAERQLDEVGRSSLTASVSPREGPKMARSSKPWCNRERGYWMVWWNGRKVRLIDGKRDADTRKRADSWQLRASRGRRRAGAAMCRGLRSRRCGHTSKRH